MLSPDSKYLQLISNLKTMNRLAIAFSGGVDSTFLLKVAADVLVDRVVAVTAVSAIYRTDEIEAAEQFAEALGVRHVLIENHALNNPSFVQNPPNKCYLCKRDLFTQIKAFAKAENIPHVADGTNLDDMKDYRPGLKALEELEIQSPLRDAELTKSDIRALSKELHLSTWDQPSQACLASRFPYQEPIIVSALEMVRQAEQYLSDLGFRQFRVRHHDQLARIEVVPEELNRITEKKLKNSIVSTFKTLGYVYVTLDLEGFRSGSLNEVLKS